MTKSHSKHEIWSLLRLSSRHIDQIVHLTYVTTYGLKRNKHSGIVQSEVTLDDLFGPV